MSKPRHHVLDIYDAHIHAARDLKGWASLRRSFDWIAKKPEASGLTSSSLWVPKSGQAVFHVAFYIDRADCGDDQGMLVNTCAHEATHGAARILEHIGQPVTDDEATCYLVGWLTAWLWEAAQS